MNITNKKTLIFMEKNKLQPKGGPSAVCYYYNIEKNIRHTKDFDFLPPLNSNASLHKKEELIKNKLPYFIKLFYNSLKQIIKTNILLGGKYPVPRFDLNKYDMIHFHDTKSMYIRRRDVDKYKGIIVLQSHSPQPLGQELYNVIPSYIRFFVPNIKKRFERMDRYAFERADYIIFPCEEAEEPYIRNWPYYKYIREIKKNNYKYVLTGIPTSMPKRSKEEVFDELKIDKTKFIVTYVGRHNKVKGYDRLKNIAIQYFNLDPNAYFICAGKEGPLTSLNHPRWIEIGFTKDAHSYISASDVFILPNTETYFDIVMLEVLSLGKIVIASRTGGNKYFEKNGCEGVFLFDTEDEAIELLKKIKSMTREERYLLGERNKKFYEMNNTVSKMYDSYVKTIQEIYKEQL